MADRIQVILISLLDNFSSEIKNIELSEELSISFHDNLNDEDFLDLCGKDNLSMLKEIFGKITKPSDSQLVPFPIGVNNVFRRIGTTKHAVVWKPQAEFEKKISHKFVKLVFNKTVSALRIYKGEYVTLFPIVIINDPVIIRPGGYSQFISLDNIGKLNIGEGVTSVYHISANDKTEELIKIYSSIENSKKAATQIAINRLNYIYDRYTLEDALIDLIIGFESLYNVHDELTLRLANRIAFHLGKSTQERGDIFNLIKDAYSARSSLVHGNKYKLAETDVVRKIFNGDSRILIDRLILIFRKSLLSILLEIGEGDFFSDGFMNQIDEAIAKGLNFQDFLSEIKTS